MKGAYSCPSPAPPSGELKPRDALTRAPEHSHNFLADQAACTIPTPETRMRYRPRFLFDARTDYMPAHSPPVLSVAASCRAESDLASGAYAASTGEYGIRAKEYPAARTGPNRIAVMELKALFAFLRLYNDEPLLVVVCSSPKSVELLKSWQNGRMRYPEGYNPKPADRDAPKRPRSLVALSRLIAERPRGYEFFTLKTHPVGKIGALAAALAVLGRCHIDYRSLDEVRREARCLAERTTTERLREFARTGK